jgi:hypothetical protein
VVVPSDHIGIINFLAVTGGIAARQQQPAGMPGASELGDSFHHMDRDKVPMHHSFKKAYCLALRRAWFMFKPTTFDALVAALKADGLTDAPHAAARATLTLGARRARLYGTQADSKTGASFFNAAAWGRANNVLAEIHAG